MKKIVFGFMAVILAFVSVSASTPGVLATDQKYTVDYTEYNKVEADAKNKLEVASQKVVDAELELEEVAKDAMDKVEQKHIEGYNQQEIYEQAHKLKEEWADAVATVENESELADILVAQAELAMSEAKQVLAELLTAYEQANDAHDAVVKVQHGIVDEALSRVETKTLDILQQQQMYEDMLVKKDELTKTVENADIKIAENKLTIDKAVAAIAEKIEIYDTFVKDGDWFGAFIAWGEVEKEKKVQGEVIAQAQYDINVIKYKSGPARKELATLTTDLSDLENYLMTLNGELESLENAYIEIEREAQEKMDESAEAISMAEQAYVHAYEYFGIVETSLEEAYALQMNASEDLAVANQNLTLALEAFELAGDALVTISNELDTITKIVEANVADAQARVEAAQVDYQAAKDYLDGVIAGGKQAAERKDKEDLDQSEHYIAGYGAGYDAIIIVFEKEAVTERPTTATSEAASQQPATGDESTLFTWVGLLGMSAFALFYVGKKKYAKI
ncbi:hypothetical protein A4S06_05910 [Erysipelotrichaceae bacterium MTC7]|nr:hypothetical protein A4S06_05910 [Erysipelotrichaceae bacterium MTC7]